MSPRTVADPANLVDGQCAFFVCPPEGRPCDGSQHVRVVFVHYAWPCYLCLYTIAMREIRGVALGRTVAVI